MVCLSIPYHFKFLEGCCLPQISLGPFLDTLSQMLTLNETTFITMVHISDFRIYCNNQQVLYLYLKIKIKINFTFKSDTILKKIQPLPKIGFLLHYDCDIPIQKGFCLKIVSMIFFSPNDGLFKNMKDAFYFI